ncbi:MAG: putative glycoside hydrolase, partial [Lysobacter sp.]
RWVKANHPDWIVKDRSGRPVTFWGNELHLYDVGNKAYQDEWVRRAIDAARSGGFDGVFADDVNMGESFRTSWSAVPAKYPSDITWTQATESFLKNVAPKLKAAGITLMPNVASAWNSDRATQVRWAKLAGAYAREHYESWPSGDAPGENDINKGLLGSADWVWMAALHRDVVSAGIPFYAFPHAGGWRASDKMRYTRASFLLWHDSAVAGGFAYATGGGPDTGQDPYNDAWAFELGSPSGPAVQQSSGVWSRQFAGGRIVVDSNAKTASVIR